MLPSAPRASRGPGIDENLIPTTPPFQANIGNLHYEIEEEDIFKFFENLEILELKLPRDHVTNRIKGFGFIIFGSRQDLIDAEDDNWRSMAGATVRENAPSSFSDRRPERGDRSFRNNQDENSEEKTVRSQSSNQSIEKPDSDPEDERDFKFTMQVVLFFLD